MLKAGLFMNGPSPSHSDGKAVCVHWTSTAVQLREGQTTAWHTLLSGPEAPVSPITGFSIFPEPLVLGSHAAEDPRGLAEP